MSNVYSNVESINLERKIDVATEGLQNHLKQKLQSIHSQQAFTITRYIISMKSETNLSDNYRRLVIIVLSGLSKYHNDKLFNQMTKNDILDFLDSFKSLNVTMTSNTELVSEFASISLYNWPITCTI